MCVSFDHTGAFYKSQWEDKYLVLFHFGSHSEGTDVWHFFSCAFASGTTLPQGAVPSWRPCTPLSQLRALAVDEVLICSSSHLPAWAGSGQTWDRRIEKQNIAFFMPSSMKQSAICAGTILLFKHSRQPF